MATPPKKADDSLPTYDGSLYLIATRAVQALRSGTGVGGKLRGATRQLAQVGPHARRRWRALSIAGKLATAVLLVAVGVGAAAAFWVWRVRPDPARLRAHIRAELAAGSLLEARRDLEELKHLTWLTRQDRRELADPLQARLAVHVVELRARIDAARKAGQWNEALAAVDDWEAFDVDAAGAAFTRGEVLRAASRPAEAAAAYGRFVQLFPENDRADDALFWQALVTKEQGDRGKAKQLLDELVTRYPKSNFLVSGRRLRAELDSVP